jgi:pyridinium-3,5-bisthiocarboxylic acid mononucleotide nickel chelatase
MTIAALVHLGVPFSIVEQAVGALGLPGIELRIERTQVGAIGARRLEVVLAAQQSERQYSEIDALIASATLEPPVSALARRIFRRLAEAESEVHEIPVGAVHFHEVGALDAIADIVGAAACFVRLGARVVATPLPMGRGTVECRHGVLPLPAPATVACLRGIPTYDAGIDAELVTPTGAAIVATVAERFERWPSFRPERIGWGAGSRELADRPNVLRAVLGATEKPAQGESSTHVVLEANVDDMTGELAAHALEALFAAGALDAWAQPITMKKGRPALTLSALAAIDRADLLAETMLRETSTLGVRRLELRRLERPRRTIEVATRFGPIPVKIGEGPYGPPQLKPEFDACARAAVSAGVPVRDVIAEALAAARALQ